MSRFLGKTFATAAALAFLATSASAQTLKVALTSEPTAIDPHFFQSVLNNAVGQHIFDSLVKSTGDLKIEPGLAASWQIVDDNTWEFKLRDAKFTNGAAFTADDVIFSFCRILNNPGATTTSYRDTINKFQSVVAKDPRTVTIVTKSPFPLLLLELVDIGMIWNGTAKHGDLAFDPAKGCGVTGEWPVVNQFNDGSAAIGTGPYKLKSYVKGTGTTLTRNDTYWGKTQAWTEVQFLPVPNNGARLAGLLAGDYDMIENAPARELAQIKQNPKLDHTVTLSNRVVFLQMDVARDPSPGVKSDKGNPFSDARVRQAVSKAINRKLIVERIMDGAAIAANQYLPDHMFGAFPNAPELAYDPAGAKALMTAAGYPNGFSVTLATTNDRVINDAQIAQTVAQFLSQIGIKTEVDAMTQSIFFPKRARREFSFALGSWNSYTGEASSFLQYWVTTTNPELGIGGSNYGGFSDPAIDALLVKALGTVKPELRSPLLQEAVKLTLDKMPEIPLHFETNIWAFKKGIAYEGRVDSRTLAMSATRTN